MLSATSWAESLTCLNCSGVIAVNEQVVIAEVWKEISYCICVSKGNPAFFKYIVQMDCICPFVSCLDKGVFKWIQATCWLTITNLRGTRKNKENNLGKRQRSRKLVEKQEGGRSWLPVLGGRQEYVRGLRYRAPIVSKCRGAGRWGLLVHTQGRFPNPPAPPHRRKLASEKCRKRKL